MLFDIMPGAIVGAYLFVIWIFKTDSEIANVYFVGELGEVPILLIKLILSDTILNLSIITPKHHS